MREYTCHVHFRWLWQQSHSKVHYGCLEDASFRCRDVWEDGSAMRSAQALGPSGGWGAHGEPWLWQTEEMVMGFSSLPPSSQSVCSTSVTWAALPRRGAAVELLGSCLPPSSFGLWPPRTSAVKKTKVFDSFAPDDDSPARLLLLTSFLLCAGRARLWHSSPSCHLLGGGVCTRRAEYTGALSPAAPLPSPGIMTTWRRRKKFVFLVFALRVLGWSVASEKADNAGPTAQEGKKATFQTTKMFCIIHWACWYVVLVSAGLCGWTDSGINRWNILLQHKQAIHPPVIHYFNGTVVHIPAHFPDSLFHCPFIHIQI